MLGIFGVTPPYQLWPGYVHIISDVVDLASFVWFLLDCKLVESDWSPTKVFREDNAFTFVTYLIALGLMLPVFGVLLHIGGLAGKHSPWRRAYLYGEILFDLGEGALFTYLTEFYNGGNGVQSHNYAVKVLMAFTTSMDLFVVKGPEAIKDMLPEYFPVSQEVPVSQDEAAGNYVAGSEKGFRKPRGMIEHLQEKWAQLSLQSEKLHTVIIEKQAAAAEYDDDLKEFGAALKGNEHLPEAQDAIKGMRQLEEKRDELNEQVLKHQKDLEHLKKQMSRIKDQEQSHSRTS